MDEFVVLAAIQVTAPNGWSAQNLVASHLPTPGKDGVECWWIAEDDRQDGSDNDSAVFVSPGTQEVASTLLHAAGLTPDCNLVAPTGTFAPNPAEYAEQVQAVKERLLDWLAEPAKGI
jgi:hypothetical protein